MDAAEADLDIKLQKISNDLLVQFDDALSPLLRKSDGRGGTIPRSRIRSRELFRLTSGFLDPFQELPQLLDPHLPKWIPFLSDTYLELLLRGHSQRARQHSSGEHLVSAEYAICKLIYTFCKIRGEKVIVRFLNVEAKYLELLTSAIEGAETEDPKNKWAWEQRYVVLLWISHLLLAPFDLSTISSVDREDMTVPTIAHFTWPDGLPGIAVRVMLLGINYLASPGRERDAAKAVIVRISMRRDMQQLGLLDALVAWALECLQPRDENAGETAYFYLGVLSFLAGALRSSSDTSDMDKHLQSIFHTVHSVSSDEATSSKAIASLALARKMILKVMRSVVVSLLRQPEQTEESTELTETAIGSLLESVADNDTPVRLLASKSLSIITLKLDPFMASQVVEAVLDSLNRNVLWTQPTTPGGRTTRDLSSVNSLEWHGLMLTLSHLLYRRSPPADQLPDIIHALLVGLSFEQRSTSGGSVGSNVRDAACFGIWAVARRYTTEELKNVSTQSVLAARTHDPSSSIIQVLATELVTTACLDPAGNIRRGASAALQELIGRHPNTVDEGIGVVQAVDYHAVARRSRALAEVAHAAAQLSKKYGETVVDGILGWRGVGDADAASRRDAARGYGTLTAELAFTASDPTTRLLAAVDAINARLDQLAQRQVEERHGLLLCYAEVVGRFSTFMQKDATGQRFDNQHLVKVVGDGTQTLQKLSEATFRRPELVAEGASRLVVSLVPLLQALVLDRNIQNMPQLSMDLDGESSADFMSLVKATAQPETVSTVVSDLVSVLRKAVPLWLARNEWETVEPASQAAIVLLIFSPPEQRIETLKTWTDGIRTKPTSRKAEYGNGYLHALALAQPLAHTVSDLSNEPGKDVVTQAFLGRWEVDDDVDTRVAILQSLTRSRMLRHQPVVFLELLGQGLNDYTTNARGDVGSHVRVQSLRAVQALWATEAQDQGGAWSTEALGLLFGDVLRLAAEKLDRVRPEAQAALGLTFCEEARYRQDFLSLTFSSQAYFSSLLNLLENHDKFLPPVRQYLRTHSDPVLMTAHLLAGYVTSADTGNEDLVVASRAALCARIRPSTTRDTSASTVGQALLQNLRANQGNDRVIIPTLEIVAFLFRTGLLQTASTTEDGSSLDLKALCLQTQKAGYKSGSVRKIEACVKTYGGIAAAGQEVPAKEARKRLGALLFHPWPKVRSMVVDEIWGLFERDGDRMGRAKAAEGLLGVDWGRASKTQIKAVVEELSLV